MIPATASGASVFAATRTNNDEGVIVTFDTGGTFNLAMLLDGVDPENPRTYAAAMATDGFALYYTTAGTLAGGRSRGVFRLDLLTDGAVPERLADLASDGGAIAVARGALFWLEPAAATLWRLALD